MECLELVHTNIYRTFGFVHINEYTIFNVHTKDGKSDSSPLSMITLFLDVHRSLMPWINSLNLSWNWKTYGVNILRDFNQIKVVCLVGLIFP